MMPSSRIPSPARSHGAKSTPRRYKPRASRSVGSPARSSSSVKLSGVIQLDSFNLSPMPTRRSVLADTTDIDIPRRKTWWKKLDENSRELIEVFNNKESAETNNAIEEYIEVDILSQEKKNYTLDIPESSDGESIGSIIIPQRKLFTQKESKPQKKFAQIIDNRETLAVLQKNQGDDDKSLIVGRKNLFSQGSKQRVRPLFPSALLNISANKTKELASNDRAVEIKNLFGNRPGKKRKNMFTDFIVSQSDDEIPEIQPQVFGFQKKVEQEQPQNLKSHGNCEPYPTSPTSSITDIEIDDWKLLPSSTMVGHQLEDELKTTPIKRARLGKLSEKPETVNTTKTKTKQSNKSLLSNSKLKGKSKHLSKFKEMDINELIASRDENIQSDPGVNKNLTIKNMSHERNSEKDTLKRSKSENVSLIKPVNNAGEVFNDLEDKNSEICRTHKYDKNSKTSSKIDEVLQSDDDDGFTLIYENDDVEVENAGINIITENKSQDPKASLKATNHSISTTANMTKQLQDKLKMQSVIHQTSQIDDEDIVNEQENIPNKVKKKLQTSIRNMIVNKKQEASKIDINGQTSSKCFEVEHYETKDKCKHDSQITKKDISTQNDYAKNITNQKEQDAEDDNDVCQYGLDYIKQLGKSVNQEINNEEKNLQEDPSILEKGEEKDTHNSDKNQFDGEDRINETAKTEKTNVIHDTTSRHRQKNNSEVRSPEAILHDKPAEMESFVVQGRNTSVRKTKSIIKSTPSRPSFAPVRERISYSDGSRDSSAEGSGWDSHRTTRATLRQTFGKDFTLRKSLRSLVMEKSAKHRTSLSRTNPEIKKLPQANSTELPESEAFTMSEINVDEKMVESYHEVSQNKSANKAKSGENQTNKCDDSSKVHETNHGMLHEMDDAQKINQFNNAKKMENTNQEVSNKIEVSNNAQKINKSNQRDQINKYDGYEMNESGQERGTCNSDDAYEINKSDDAHEMNNDSNDEREMNDSDGVHEMNDSDDAHEMNKSDDAHEMNDSNDEREMNDSDGAHEMNDSVDVHEMNKSDDAHEMSGSNDAHEMNDSDDAHEMNDSDDVHEMNKSDDAHEMNDSNDAHEMNDSNDAPEMNDTDDAHEMNRSDDAHEMNDSNDAHEMNNSDDVHEINKSDVDEMNDSYDAHAINASDQVEPRDTDESTDAQKSDESSKELEFNESDQEMSQGSDQRETCDVDDSQEMNESDNVQDVNENSHILLRDIDKANEDMDVSNEYQKKSVSNIAQEINELNHESEYTQNIESDHELSRDKDKSDKSRKERQTTLETYLRKIARQDLERKKQLEDEITNSLKPPTRDMFNPFKIPAVPSLRRTTAQTTKSKVKPRKTSAIPLDMLPDEVLQDMKYKPPKRYRPTNASWVTKTLYKFLETKLEPKYDYKARVRSEKLVETIYSFTKHIRRHSTAPADAVDVLKHEMARLEVVKTHFEFYEFFHEYMPREVRVKVVPDLFNKISLPKHGIFSDILRS